MKSKCLTLNLVSVKLSEGIRIIDLKILLNEFAETVNISFFSFTWTIGKEKKAQTERRSTKLEDDRRR